MEGESLFKAISIYLSPFIFISIIAIIGDFFGKNRAERKLKKEIAKVKLHNPYIYYRDIPNNYGIGVYALLLDYKIDERDLKAAIIDLSAKKYIKLVKHKDKFEVEILDKKPENILENEKYILDWIRENRESKLKKFNLGEWKNMINKDSVNLGLAEYRKNVKHTPDYKRGKLSAKIGIGLVAVAFAMTYFYLFRETNGTSGFDLEFGSNFLLNAIMLLLWLLVNIPIPMIISIVIGIVYFIISSIVKVFYYSDEDAYAIKMFRQVKYTEKSVDTLRQIYSLGAFLKDFSNFAERDIEEIIIWERYFAFAYLFGLNDKLKMRYVKIFKNECFELDNHIDDIDSLTVINGENN